MGGAGVTGGGQLHKFSIEDVRFLDADDPITTNDLYLDGKPTWDAKANFITGELVYLNSLKGLEWTTFHEIDETMKIHFRTILLTQSKT